MRAIVVVLIVMCILVPVSALGQAAAPAAPVVPPMRLEPRPCPLMALRFIRPAMVPGLAKTLNLTEEQTAKFNDLLTRTDEALKPKVEEQRKATKEFAEAMADPNASQTAIMAAFEKAAKTETAIAGEMIKTLVALRGLLTDQQKVEFNKMVEMRVDPWKRDFGVFGPGPTPPPSGRPTPTPAPPAAAEPKAGEAGK